MIKKRLIFLALIGIFLLGCSTEPGFNAMLKINPEIDLNKATQRRILKDYYNIYVKPYPYSPSTDFLRIERYYGTYNGMVAFWIHSSLWDYHASMPIEFFIADIRFYYHDWQLHFWNDGKFYHDLQEIYDLGLLTQDDLRIIAEIVNYN